MDTKEKKRLLNSYRRLVAQIKALSEALEYTGALIHSPVYDGMPHGSRNSDLSDLTIKRDEYEREMKDLIDRKLDTLRRIDDLIEAMDNEKEKEVLMYRYMRFKSFEQVAVEMRLSYRQTMRLHRLAISHFGEVKERGNDG